MLPACFVPPPPDTTGWRTVRWIGVGDERRLLCRIPGSFRRDSTEVEKHGTSRWADGDRRVTLRSDYGQPAVAEAAAGFECVDTLAGRAFVLDTGFDLSDSLYRVLGTHAVMGPGAQGVLSDGLDLTSPDSTDQKLFLAIVRTIREESWTSGKGVVFLGGHELRPPYAFTRQRDRLTVNGYRLPDLVPPAARQAAPNAELEARRSLEARLAALRDSLVQAGVDWGAAEERMKAVASSNPFVRSVQLQFEQGLRRFIVHWGIGFNRSLFLRTGHVVQMSSRERAFAEDNYLWVTRMNYLKSLLDDGCAIFLLGGGREFVVPAEHAKEALDAARRAAAARSRPRADFLPADVLDQVHAPLALVPADEPLDPADSGGAAP